MATTTRRAEGYQHPQPQQRHLRRLQQTTVANDARHAQIIAAQPQSKTRNPQTLLHQSNAAACGKRPIDLVDANYDQLASKKARIAVEIFSRSVPQPISPPRSITVRSPKAQIATSLQQLATAEKAPQPPQPPLPPPLPSIPPPTSKTAPASDQNRTRHQEKVTNGIKHELDRLKPSAADTSSAKQQPGRKLRSQEATRFKSELSAYFPDYDEVIGNDPKEQHILNLDTPILLVDSGQLQHASSSPPSTSATPVANPELRELGSSHNQPHSDTVRVYGDRLFTDLHDSQWIDFATFETRHRGKTVEDQLPDSLFAPAHRKAERLEKSIRNTERGRAQHEKDQIIRLLNELQGHDWLRTMGVSGVTESRKKTFEPARDHFIKGCQIILEKFRWWSLEEKKRKLEKERALAEEAEEKEEEDDDEEDEGEEEEEEEEVDEEIDESEEESENDEDEDVDMIDAGEEGNSDEARDGDPPDYSDVDASARQLHDEAMARARYAASSSSKKSRGEARKQVAEPVATKEFTSFFEKKHERDAALSKNRRRGRTVMAWGHPIPELPERDFELPEEYLDEELLKARERQKRRDRRQRKQ
ncbi:something about silencing, SAS, complex subunit 4-domain-containing protein [Xylariomycetidae sp. FL2044]|nr:something about silencing, SAS, complex subunit 4-domain-containing protein [Xylariomycetidae sp. FL2044]